MVYKLVVFFGVSIQYSVSSGAYTFTFFCIKLISAKALPTCMFVSGYPPASRTETANFYRFVHLVLLTGHSIQFCHKTDRAFLTNAHMLSCTVQIVCIWIMESGIWPSRLESHYRVLVECKFQAPACILALVFVCCQV